MSSSSQAAEAATMMATSLGMTNMDITKISKMLQLQHVLYPMFQVSVAFLVLTWIAVLFRIYTRTIVIKSFGWDDALMLLAQALFTSTCACLIAIEDVEMRGSTRMAVENGLLSEFPIVERTFQLVLGFMALYIITTVVLKLSLAIFFLRVIPNGWQRKVIYYATAIYAAYGIVFTFVVIFQCGNPSNFFLQQARGRCISDGVLQPLYYAAGGMNAITDWMFSILPVTVLWYAAIPRSTKISAACLLGLGSLASISSLVRLAYIPGIEASPTFLEGAVDIASWSIVEPGLGIIAASLATLRPLFRHFFPAPHGTILPTTHRGKIVTYQPGTYASRLSFEEKINPYGNVHWGSVTTVIGNSRKDATEMQEMEKSNMQLHSIDEVPALVRKSSVSGAKSGGHFGSSSSQRSLMHWDRKQIQRSGSATPKKAFIADGRVIMTRDIRLEQEPSVYNSQSVSPV